MDIGVSGLGLIGPGSRFGFKDSGFGVHLGFGVSAAAILDV